MQLQHPTHGLGLCPGESVLVAKVHEQLVGQRGGQDK